MSTPEYAESVRLRDAAIWDAVVEGDEDYDETVRRIVRYLTEAGFTIERHNDGTQTP